MSGRRQADKSAAAERERARQADKSVAAERERAAAQRKRRAAACRTHAAGGAFPPRSARSAAHCA